MSVRYRERNDGTPYWQVRFREHGRERSISWDNPVQAEQFDNLIKQVGASRAREICKIAAAPLRETTHTEIRARLDRIIKHLVEIKEILARR